MDRVQTAGDLLVSAFTTGAAIRQPEFDLADQAEAYWIQAAVAQALGPLSGWKVGRTAEGSYVRAPLYTRRTHASGVRLARQSFHHFLVESELAVRFAQDFPARGSTYSRDEVIAGIASLHAAIETVDSPFADWPKVDPLWSLAGGLSHGCFVLGSGIEAPQLEQLAQAQFELEVGGQVIKAGQASHPAVDPWAMLVWLVNALCDAAEPVRAGMLVTTGTFTGATSVAPGQAVRVRFQGVGQVTLALE